MATNPAGVPHLMVATVGTSPLPIVLSARTIAPRTLVLVHTDATKSVLGPIETALKGTATAIVRLHCGAGTHFHPTYQTMHDGLEKLLPTHDGGLFLLDYTGGTSVMVAVAVALHIELHGRDLPALRMYVDDTAGTLVGDNGTHHHITAHPTLTETAALHGFVLAGSFGTPAGQTSAAAVIDPDAVEEGRGEVARRRQGGTGVSDVPILRKALARNLVHITVTGERLDPDGTEKIMADDAGKAGHALELVTVAALMRHRWDEIAYDVTVKDPNGGKDNLLQFDAVARSGHRILAVEVKTSQNDLIHTAGSRLAGATLTFGGLTRMLSVCAASTSEADRAQRDWAPVLSDLERWKIDRLDCTDTATLGASSTTMLSTAIGLTSPARDHTRPAQLEWGQLVHQVQREWRERAKGAPARISDPPAAGAAAVVDYDTTVTAPGGSIFAVSRARSLGHHSILVGTEATLNAYVNTTTPAATAQSDFGRATVGSLAANLVREGLESALVGRSAVALVITPATKSATAAMTAFAAGTDHDLVHVDAATDTVHSWRRGTHTHRTTETWSTIATPEIHDLTAPETDSHSSGRADRGPKGLLYREFENDTPPGQFVDGYRNRISGPAMYEARRPTHELLVTACRQITTTTAAHADSSTRARVVYSPQPEADWWAPALILGERRLVAVVPVIGTWYKRHTRNEPHPGDIGKSREALYAVDRHVDRLAGDVGALLVLLPTDNATSTTRADHKIERDTRWLRTTPPPWIGYWSTGDPDTPILDPTILTEIAEFLGA